MGFGEKIVRQGGTYYRARYKIEGRKFGIVRSPDGSVARFRTRNEAKQAASDAEAALRTGHAGHPSPENLSFGEWANRWYAGLELAASTMANYRRHLEEHILPRFAGEPLAAITPAGVDTWEKAERAAGYAASSVKTWRTTLHTCLADAMPALIPANPATKKRGRGIRAGRSRNRAPEKVITDPLGALLIAERAALLARRDDEFVIVMLKYWTGMRWAEITGLERQYFRLKTIRVEHQLYELEGRLIRCPPKDDSYRDIDLPPFLADLISGHITRVQPGPCDCHGHTYIFRGRGSGSRTAAHHRRSGFETWVFTPAASGWYPKRSADAPRPVPLLADPWPGAVVLGRNSQGRAEANWAPLARGLTPHGLRHAHKTLMAELRTPEVLSHERLGHELGGIGGRYTHVTPDMRAELLRQLTRRWLEALDARLAMHPRSPVAVLDGLLQARGRALGREGDSKIITRLSPDRASGGLRIRPVNRA